MHDARETRCRYNEERQNNQGPYKVKSNWKSKANIFYKSSNVQDQTRATRPRPSAPPRQFPSPLVLFAACSLCICANASRTCAGDKGCLAEGGGANNDPPCTAGWLACFLAALDSLVVVLLAGVTGSGEVTIEVVTTTPPSLTFFVGLCCRLPASIAVNLRLVGEPGRVDLRVMLDVAPMAGRSRRSRTSSAVTHSERTISNDRKPRTSMMSSLGRTSR